MQEKASSGKFKPAHGQDFEGRVSVHVEIIKAQTDRATASTRDVIAKAAVVVIVAALALAVGLRFLDGNFNALQITWAIIAPYVGYMFATYMWTGAHRKDDG